MVALSNGEVREDNYHWLFLLEVGASLCIKMTVVIAESFELLDCELTTVSIEDNDLVQLRIEPKPIVVVRSEEDLSSISHPCFQDGRFSSVRGTINPIVTLFLLWIEGILRGPPVLLNFLLFTHLLVDLEVLSYPLERAIDDYRGELLNHCLSDSTLLENHLTSNRCL